jgi:hypothetical protein
MLCRLRRGPKGHSVNMWNAVSSFISQKQQLTCLPPGRLNGSNALTAKRQFLSSSIAGLRGPERSRRDKSWVDDESRLDRAIELEVETVLALLQLL